jgi:hypothetical protein
MNRRQRQCEVIVIDPEGSVANSKITFPRADLQVLIHEEMQSNVAKLIK